MVGTHNENAEKVVKTLIDYNADVRKINFDRLFSVSLQELEPW